MTNAFRHTPDGRLDRKYLRVAACYRCADRFGMSAAECQRRLSERMSETDAKALVSIWRQSLKLRQSPTFNAA